MHREIIRLREDVPVTVLLDGNPDGKPKRNPNGDTDYQYICNGNSKIIWLSPNERSVLLNTGARAGDLVELLRTRMEFRARVVSDAAEPSLAAQNGPQAPCALTSQNNGRGATPASVPRDFAEQLARESSERRAWSQSNGNGGRQPVRVISEHQAPVTAHNGRQAPCAPPAETAHAAEDEDYYAQQYVRCYRSALIAAGLCAQEAKRFGLMIGAPTDERVGAMATTFFIEQNRRTGGAR